MLVFGVTVDEISKQERSVLGNFKFIFLFLNMETWSFKVHLVPRVRHMNLNHLLLSQGAGGGN